MKKFVNLLLVVLILVGGWPSEAKHKRSGASSQATNKILAVCDQPDGTYMPGELIVTMTEDLDPSKAKITTAKAFYSMRKNNSLTLLKSKLAASALLSIEPLYEADPDKEENLTRLARKTQDSKEVSSLNKIVKFHRLMRESKVSRSYVMKTTNTQCENLEKFISDLRKDSNVEHIELNRIHQERTIQSGVPNDEYFSAQNNLTKIKAPESWDVTTGNNVQVGVIDQYLKTNHADLQANINTTDSLFNSTSSTSTHGTQVASMIATVGDNDIGIVGVAPDSKIVFVSAPHLNSAETVSAITHLINKNIKVINMSYGSYLYGRIADLNLETFYAQHQDASTVAIAINSGISVVVASGNENMNVDGHTANVRRGGKADGEIFCSGTVQLPCYDEYSAVPGVINVSATTSTDTRTSFSNFGNSVTLSAPGERVPTASFDEDGNDAYYYANGTSFSAPTVAGAVALLLQVKSNLTPAQVRDLLTSTGDLTVVETDNKPIGKRLNVKGAVDELQSRMTLAAPVLNSATNDSKTLSANWSMVSGNVNAGTIRYKYKVYKQTTTVDTDFITGETFNISVPISTASLAVDTYKFKVQACNDYGCGAFSNDKDFSIVDDATATPDAVIIPPEQFTHVDRVNKALISTPNIRWLSVPTAYSYNTALTEPNNPTPKLDSVEINGLSLSPSLGDYNIAVTAVNSVGPGLVTTSQGFTLVPVATVLPGAVTIKSPAPSAGATDIVITNKKPSFTWTSLDTTVFAYELSLEKLQPDSKTVIDKLILSDNSHVLATDLELGRYRLKVHAINIVGHKLDDTIVDFYVADSSSNVPLAVTGITVSDLLPNDSSRTTEGKPTIQWQAIPGVIYYELEIAKASSAATNATYTLLKDMPVVVYDTSYKLESNLELGRYRIRIRARNASGPGSYSADKILNVVPKAVQFNIPVALAGLEDINIFQQGASITWSQSPVDLAGAITGYKVTLRNLTTNKDVKTVTSTSTSYVLANTESIADYSILVIPQSIGGDGISNTLNFTVAAKVTAKPGPVTITSPDPKGTTIYNIATPSFTWTAVTGAVRYEIYLSQTYPITRDIIVDLPNKTTSYTPSPSLSYGTYSLKVRAINALGRGNYPTTGVSFKVTTPNSAKAKPGTVTVTDPKGSGNPPIITTTKPLIKWNAVPLTDFYTLTLYKLDTYFAKYEKVNASPIERIDTSYQWPDDLALGSYKVEVTANNAYGPSATITPYLFVIGAAAASVPVAPDIIISGGFDFERGLARSPYSEVTWVTDPGADYYDIKITDLAKNITFDAHRTRLSLFRGTIVTSLAGLFQYKQTADQFIYSIPPNILYRLTVTARNSAGSSTSTTRDFFFGLAPTAPTLTLRNYITKEKKPQLKWTKPTPGTISSYELRIENGRTGDLVQNHVGITKTYFTPSSELTNGFYKFKVRAVYSFGTVTAPGLWSIEKVFYVADALTVLPGKPTITAPAATNELMGATPRIKWNPGAAAAAVYYNVYFYDCSSVISCNNPFPLYSQSPYYFPPGGYDIPSGFLTSDTEYQVPYHFFSLNNSFNPTSKYYMVQVIAYNYKGATASDTRIFRAY